jgi:hypothetical protein
MANYKKEPIMYNPLGGTIYTMNSDEVANLRQSSFSAEHMAEYGHHLVSCWNACLNFENPEADIKQLVEALKFTRENLFDDEYPKTCEILDSALALVKEETK